MVSGSFDKSIIIWEYNDIKYEWDIRQIVDSIWEDMVYSVKLNKDNSILAVGNKDKNIYLLDLEGNPIGLLEGHSGIVNSLCFY